MSYTCEVSGFVMLNATLPLTHYILDENYNFIRRLEESYSFKVIRREIVDSVRWRYLIEFNSEAEATMFLLRFS